MRGADKIIARSAVAKHTTVRLSQRTWHIAMQNNCNWMRINTHTFNWTMIQLAAAAVTTYNKHNYNTIPHFCTRGPKSCLAARDAIILDQTLMGTSAQTGFAEQ